MTPPIEILVHVSGPSRGADDARYRTEARKFLDFEPVTRYTICPLKLPENWESRLSEDWDSGAKQSSEQTNSTDEPFLLDVLPSQSLAREQVPAEQASHDTPNTALKSPNHPFKTPAPVSRPTPSTTLQRTSIKETPHLLVERTPALPRPRTAPTAASHSAKPQPLRRTQSDSWQTPPSVIPNSQPTPATSTLSRPEVSSSPYLKRPFDSSSPSPTRAEASPSAKRQRLQLVSSSPVGAPAVKGLTSIGPTLPSMSPAADYPAANGVSNSLPSSLHLDPPPSSPIPTTAPESLEIHPPPPAPSTSHFKTHLTPSLTTISSKLPSTKYYKPLSTSRSLGPLERGHWLIPLGTFPPALLVRFWDFLTAFVGEGRAGWGTWCVREYVDVVREEIIVNEWKDVGEGESRREEVAKIYCWGEVVGEIWLVLFLASSRKVKGVGARWIDAGGQVVVAMK